MHLLVGGTFDRLHRGHIKLLEVAFKYGEVITIAICSDEMIRGKPWSWLVESYEVRKRRIELFARRQKKPFQLIQINDPYEPAASMSDLDGIVVSTETLANAIRINELRKSRRLHPLRIYAILLVRDKYGNVISSRKIRERVASAKNYPK